MKKDPRMSPLYAETWARLSDSTRDAIIADLKPTTKLEPGDSFQVAAGGAFVLLEPGTPVPAKPVREDKHAQPLA